jgi:hypothetical protein
MGSFRVMHRSSRFAWVAVLLLVAGSILAGCSEESLEERRFRENRDDYQAAVSWVMGAIEAKGPSAFERSHLPLPPEYASLSDGGEVEYYGSRETGLQEIGFYTMAGELLGPSQLIYYSVRDDFPEEAYELKLAPHWYAVYSP